LLVVDNLAPWLDAEEERAWRGFHALRTQLLGRLNRSLLEESGLSGADFEVLVAVSEAPGKRLRAVELGRALGWEKSRLSHQVTRMESRDLVRREGCKDGSRGAEVVLTALGRRMIKDAAPTQLAEIRANFIDLLTPAQLRTLAEIADVVVTHLEAQPDD
jgi:DNA-binding MarR family transcriptional regulator